MSEGPISPSRPNNRRPVSRMAELRHFYPELTIIFYDLGMDEDKGTEAPINFPRDNIKDSEWKVDPAVYTAARIFNAVALPDDMPDFLKEVIDAKAEQAKISAQEAGFVAPDTNRLIDGKTIQERERDKDEENRLYIASVVQEVEQRLERERQEWARTSSTVGGITMTGAEWSKLADRMRNDDDLRRRIMDVFEKRGMTKQEAEARYERVADIAEIAAIPPSQRTGEQNATMKKAETDPTFKKDISMVQSIMTNQTTATPVSDLNQRFTTAAIGLPAENMAAPVPTYPAPIISSGLEI